MLAFNTFTRSFSKYDHISVVTTWEFKTLDASKVGATQLLCFRKVQSKISKYSQETFEIQI